MWIEAKGIFMVLVFFLTLPSSSASEPHLLFYYKIYIMVLRKRHATKCEINVKGRFLQKLIKKQQQQNSRRIERAIYIFIAKSYKNQLHGQNALGYSMSGRDSRVCVNVCFIES